MEEIGIFDHQPQQDSTASTRPSTTASGYGGVDGEQDMYIKFKKLQRQLEFLQVNNYNYNYEYLIMISLTGSRGLY